MLDDAVLRLAAELLERCRAGHVMLATAESCTGGLVAAALTAIAGSSDVVDRGFVTYSNEAKTDLVAVPAALIAAHGAVSEPVAAAMAEGAVRNSRATIAVSITGIAGPGGGSPEKPVGTVWFGAHRSDGATITQHRLFPGDRTAIRAASVIEALHMVQRLL
jgi:nicotinamide-nucleotide amidase